MSLDTKIEESGRPHLDPKKFVMRDGDKVSKWSMLDEDGKPTHVAQMRFERSYAYQGHDLNVRAQKVHAKVLPMVKALFDAGDLDNLMDLAQSTSPGNYRKSGLGLETCQVVNDLVSVALSILIGEDAVRKHAYNYQPSFGQESGDVALARAEALSGVHGAEAQKEASAILKAKNPEPDKTPLNENLTATAAIVKSLLEGDSGAN